MFCRNCGKEIPDNAKFCKYCGNPVHHNAGGGSDTPHIDPAPQPAPEPGPTPVRPPQPEIKPTPVRQPQPKPQPQPAPDNRSRNKSEKKSPLVAVLVIIIIVLASAVCAFGAMWYLKIGPFKEQEEGTVYENYGTDESGDDSSDKNSSSDSGNSSEDNKNDSSDDSNSPSDNKSDTDEKDDDKGKDDKEKKEVSGHDAFKDAKNGYILPNSTTERLSESDLEDFSNEELTYARNEIYAREQCVFGSEELMKYFNKKKWYDPIDSRSATDYFSDLNKVEQDNAKLILDYQKDTYGSPYKPN